MNLSAHSDPTLHYLNVDPGSVELAVDGAYVRATDPSGLRGYGLIATIPRRRDSTVHGVVFASNLVLHSGDNGNGRAPRSRPLPYLPRKEGVRRRDPGARGIAGAGLCCRSRRGKTRPRGVSSASLPHVHAIAAGAAWLDALSELVPSDTAGPDARTANWRRSPTDAVYRWAGTEARAFGIRRRRPGTLTPATDR